MTQSKQDPRVDKVLQGGISAFLAGGGPSAASANSDVTIDWNVEWDAVDGLTAVGNVTPNSSSATINLLIVAFTSPGYPSGGSYYTGAFQSTFNMPAGNGVAFILENQMFTAGTVVQVTVEGWLDFNLFSFSQTITIGS
jgi:hypothetical protein